MSGTTMLRRFATLFVITALAACGDDDGPAADAGHDAARDDAGDSGGFIPRRDSSVVAGDPIPDCDRIDPLACGAGQKCAWVLRFVSETSAAVYTGCVDERAERERGVPCEQWGRAYEAAGLSDETYVDPCAEGLFCAPDPNLRNVYTCQPLCEIASDCTSTEICAGTPISSTIAIPICRPSDDCDAQDQLGCGTGESCYLRPNGAYDGALALCLPHSPLTPGAGAPGDPCFEAGVQYISACQAGSVCWGDPRLTPAQWEDADIRCRSYCDPTLSSDGDAGEDACGAGQCVWLGDPALALNVSGLTVAPGVCD